MYRYIPNQIVSSFNNRIEERRRDLHQQSLDPVYMYHYNLNLGRRYISARKLRSSRETSHTLYGFADGRGRRCSSANARSV
jgi:hypothetical protein